LGGPSATQSQTQSAQGRKPFQILRTNYQIPPALPLCSFVSFVVTGVGLANCQLLFASCSFSKIFCVSRPWALLEYSYFIRPYQ
jgi:hypothetical protein